MSASDRTTTDLFGLPFDHDDGRQVAERISTAARAKSRLWVSTVNLDWLITARNDALFRETILKSDLVTCDGAPVMILSRIMGRPLPTRVTGVEIFKRLRAGEAGALRVGFFGAEGDEAERASAALNADLSTPLTGAGGYNPGHGSVDALSADEHIDAINAMKADVLILALGAVKAQAWILKNLDRLAPPVISHLGAVIRHVSGDTEEAPEALSQTGFEWAFRAFKEPALRKRYAKNFTALPGLVAQALRERFSSAK